MNFKLSFLLALTMSISTSSFASFIEGDNYVSNEEKKYWVNNDLSLDIVRLNWADTLGSVSNEQKSYAEINDYVASNDEGWRWATASEFSNILNWYDTDASVSGWSNEQNLGTNMFIELNGLGSKYHGFGALGEEYQNGYDHEGYTYWQFGTVFDGVVFDSWIADFGDQFASVTCPVWSDHCQNDFNQGYLDQDTTWRWTFTYALGLADYNVAPLLVRATAVNEPSAMLLSLLGVLLIVRTRRTSR